MRISVAMCTYNGELYVQEQLESILNQTRVPDEIIVCDDKSKDKTVEIIENCLKNSSIQYSIIKNECNLGYIHNFEKCSLLCTGDIVFFADQDDVWDVEKIQTVLCVFENNSECVMCYHDAIVTNEKLQIQHESLYGYTRLDETFFLRKAIVGKIPYGCTVAFKRELLNKIMPFRLGHDHWISMCAPLFGEIKYISTPLLLYRRNSNAITGYIRKNIVIRKFQRTYNFFKKVKSLDKEKWFIWPTAIIQSYGNYFEEFGDKIKNNDIEAYLTLEERIRFTKVLKTVIDSRKIEAVKILIYEYRKGLYRLRGNRNTLILDIIYLLLH